MPKRNVNLTDHYDSFIETNITAGRFSNASEVIRAGLHLLEREEAEEKAKLEWLRGITENAFHSLDQGEGIELTSADSIDSFVSDAVAEARASRTSPHG